MPTLMNPSQTDIVMTIRMITSIISLIFTTIGLFTLYHLRMKLGQYRLQKIIFICTLVECLVNLISFLTYRNEVTYSKLCYFQGFMMQFIQVSIFCWTCAFAFNLYLVIILRCLDTEKYRVWYHILCWGIASICTSIPQFTLAYGKTTVWCWITKESIHGNAYRIGTFFVPFYISWIIIVFLYGNIIYRLCSTLNHMTPNDRQLTLGLLRRFFLYPIIFIICYIPATINRINIWVTGNDVYVLFIIHVLASPSLGTLNGIVFFCNSDVRNALANIFIRRGQCSYCLGDVPIEIEIEIAVNHSDDEILEGALD